MNKFFPSKFTGKSGATSQEGPSMAEVARELDRIKDQNWHDKRPEYICLTFAPGSFGPVEASVYREPVSAWGEADKIMRSPDAKAENKVCHVYEARELFFVDPANPLLKEEKDNGRS